MGFRPLAQHLPGLNYESRRDEARCKTFLRPLQLLALRQIGQGLQSEKL
jgi:hypothetical protein